MRLLGRGRLASVRLCMRQNLALLTSFWKKPITFPIRFSNISVANTLWQHRIFWCYGQIFPFRPERAKIRCALGKKEFNYHKTNVKYNSDVVGIEGEKGNFTLKLSNGETVQAEHIILGIGTAGNPNKLRIPNADQPYVQYQLDDPKEYYDENIVIVGGGDAGIENALGLSNDVGQGNNVTLLQRGPDFPRSKPANVALLKQAKEQGKLDFLVSTSPTGLEDNVLTVETPDGEAKLPVDRIIARLGAAPPRKFVESIGVKFTSEDREAFPILSDAFESTAPGIFIVGALAGYPLIKHCMNQGL